MKIEKLSENQIRCTLNKADLASRQLKISELAYGSEKAKELFRDMMQQASYELGFEAEDIPLMIEAIPVSAECIILIVTKVDDPEELDTRFSKFSPASDDSYDDGDFDYADEDYDSFEAIGSSDSTSLPTARDELDSYEDSDLSDDVTSDVINLFSKVKDYLTQNIDEISESDDSSNIINTNKANNTNSSKDSFIPLNDTLLKGSDGIKKPVTSTGKTTTKQPSVSTNTKAASPADKTIRIFSFKDFNTFNDAAIAIAPVYNDINSLYKSPVDSRYYLTLEKTTCTAVNFNKTCNILSEYGTKENMNSNSDCYFKEHWECIINGRAVQVMSKL